MEENYSEESAAVETIQATEERYERMAENANKRLTKTGEKESDIAVFLHPGIPENAAGVDRSTQNRTGKMRRNREYNGRAIHKEYELIWKKKNAAVTICILNDC